MTTSQQNLEDRLRRVLSEQAQALQVDRPEWQPAAVTVATRRTGRSHGSPRLAVGLGVAITLLIAIGAIVLVGHHTAGINHHPAARHTPRTTTTPSSLVPTTPRPPAGVVSNTSTLHLKSLDAKYAGLRRNRTGPTIVMLTITNKLRTPQQWLDTMDSLFIPGTNGGDGNSPYYGEDPTGDNRDRNSCLWKTGAATHGGLQPGASVTCDVAFNIPASADPLSVGSTLLVANFHDDVSNAKQAVGGIRTHP